MEVKKMNAYKCSVEINPGMEELITKISSRLLTDYQIQADRKDIIEHALIEMYIELGYSLIDWATEVKK